MDKRERAVVATVHFQQINARSVHLKCWKFKVDVKSSGSEALTASLELMSTAAVDTFHELNLCVPNSMSPRHQDQDPTNVLNIVF